MGVQSAFGNPSALTRASGNNGLESRHVPLAQRRPSDANQIAGFLRLEAGAANLRVYGALAHGIACPPSRSWGEGALRQCRKNGPGTMMRPLEPVWGSRPSLRSSMAWNLPGGGSLPVVRRAKGPERRRPPWLLESDRVSQRLREPESGGCCALAELLPGPATGLPRPGNVLTAGCPATCQRWVQSRSLLAGPA